MIPQEIGNDKADSAHDSQYLLLRALALGVCHRPEAPRVWTLWRDRTALDGLSWEQQQVIPALSAWLRDWLSGDPDRGIIQGMVRRFWAETQTRLMVARQTARQIEAAGAGPVELAGGARFALHCRVKEALRPISEIRLLVQPGNLAASARVLLDQGWTQHGELPTGVGLDWSREIYFSRNGLHLLLQWRLMNIPPDLAPAHDAEFKGPASAEVWLLAALCGRGEPDCDPVPWQADVALTPLQAVDWRRFVHIASRYAPQAFSRMEEMRDLGLDLPSLVRP